MQSNVYKSAILASGMLGDVMASIFPHATPPIMVCSLAGSALYVLSRSQYELWKQGCFAIISFIGGIHSAFFFTDILQGVLNSLLQRLDPTITVTIPPPVGALIASTVCVSILRKILARVKNYPDTIKGRTK